MAQTINTSDIQLFNLLKAKFGEKEAEQVVTLIKEEIQRSTEEKQQIVLKDISVLRDDMNKDFKYMKKSSKGATKSSNNDNSNNYNGNYNLNDTVNNNHYQQNNNNNNNSNNTNSSSGSGSAVGKNDVAGHPYSHIFNLIEREVRVISIFYLFIYFCLMYIFICHFSFVIFHLLLLTYLNFPTCNFSMIVIVEYVRDRT